MSLKQITLRINNNKETVKTVQIAGGKGGIGSQGQAVHIQAQANVHYHFTDEATGYGPENIATKRAGKDLYIAFEGGDVEQPDLVIEGYYKDNGEIGYAEGSNNMLIGTHENGDVYPYVPESAQTSDAVSMLAEGVMAGQALGGATPFVVPLFWLPLLAAGVLGAALAGGGGGSGTPVPPPDYKPEISGLTPAADGGDAIVYEKALADGFDPSADGARGNGTFTIKSPDGIKSLTIGGVTFIADGKLVAGAKLTTPFGNELIVTGYDATTGEVRYTYTLLGNAQHLAGDGTNALFENLPVVLTDNDGDKVTNTLSVQIVDDVPTANPDVDNVAADQTGPATGNVLTGVDVATGDANATDGVADVPGADGVTVVGVAKGDTAAALDQPDTVGVALEGEYGTLTLHADGSYSYERKAGTAGGGNDVFTYTIKDGDGDLAHTTLTISIGNTPPVVGDPNEPSTANVTLLVDEKGLPPRTDEPGGSGEMTDGDGGNNTDPSEEATG
ncbi:VCBS domain-containing protein [Pelistega sp. MC2]|uniref:VCBS domain-containing protein n=1 Tax=Pelistega sp. MC2 TaxID=1720297 RepID=UPI0008D9498D|nr:VCBS domain-containing protein [Pelistega sp. MC2]